MTQQSSAIPPSVVAVPTARAIPGVVWAALGVLAFSFTFPATHVALTGFDPVVVGVGRSVLAGLLAAASLALTRSERPPRQTWLGLAIVGAGCGFGFGLLTSLALQHTSVGHIAVIVALLPLATAVVAVLRSGERPSTLFWAAACAGAIAVLALALVRGGGRPEPADGLILLALVSAAFGYAEGGRLAKSMPGWQVISWGLVAVLPLTVTVTGFAVVHAAPRPAPNVGAMLGFAYVGVVSMFLGFFAWYRGMAEIGIAAASQVQLLQPLLTLGWSALFLGEEVGAGTLAVAVFVLGCVLAAQRSRAGYAGAKS